MGGRWGYAFLGSSAGLAAIVLGLLALAPVVSYVASADDDDGLVAVPATVVQTGPARVTFADGAGEHHEVEVRFSDEVRRGQTVDLVYPPGRPSEARGATDRGVGALMTIIGIESMVLLFLLLAGAVAWDELVMLRLSGTREEERQQATVRFRGLRPGWRTRWSAVVWLPDGGRSTTLPDGGPEGRRRLPYVVVPLRISPRAGRSLPAGNVRCPVAVGPRDRVAIWLDGRPIPVAQSWGSD